MQVQVFHDGVHVANVEAQMSDVEDALEYAWRWTNNVDGSWSRGELIPHYQRRGELEDNGDYNPAVTVLVDLPVHDGIVYGLRSSMTGDIFKIEGQAYVVAMCGFDKIEE